jgi:hypothetical protein
VEPEPINVKNFEHDDEIIQVIESAETEKSVDALLQVQQQQQQEELHNQTVESILPRLFHKFRSNRNDPVLYH